MYALTRFFRQLYMVEEGSLSSLCTLLFHSVNGSDGFSVCFFLLLQKKKSWLKFVASFIKLWDAASHFHISAYCGCNARQSKTSQLTVSKLSAAEQTSSLQDGKLKKADRCQKKLSSMQFPPFMSAGQRDFLEGHHFQYSAKNSSSFEIYCKSQCTWS